MAVEHGRDHLRRRRRGRHPRPPGSLSGAAAAVITGWGIAVPDKIVTNEDLSATLDTSDAWITERTGIRQRHIGGTTSELAIGAGRQALERAGRAPAEIDLLVLATTTPDAVVPGDLGHRPGGAGHHAAGPSI